MNRLSILIIAGLLGAAPAMAQEGNLYDGTWDAKMVNNKGETRKGTVILKGQEGDWDFAWHNVKNPCVGMRAPIVVQRATAGELVFLINRSKALKGCKDSVATLQPVNAATLQGSLDDGRKLTLSRH